ncbi:hypothetical protein KIW84_021827 [Lathyrus oleraceus]|uniref:Tf2-1-like SH3-like domain-containing protein n=1 Tax=Pisum sativum TaxID=3888 RepID=A0A9D5B4H5_PEA|nr:hypothetical protein KIW84_021827 [Pisum sativum]
MHDEGKVFLLEYKMLKAGTDSVISPPSWLEGVLREFGEVFQEPKGLPPSRRQDHVIILKEGENIPNIRSYRHPHYQKNKIERLVDDMLKSGVIRPNGSTIPSIVEEVNVLTQERDQMLHELKSNIVKAQVQMKTYKDQSRRPITLSTGDWVYLRLQPYRLKSLSKKRNKKLSPRFYGPYQIIKQIGSVEFKLDLPPERKIHPVFHVSLLKKVLAPTSNWQPLP